MTNGHTEAIPEISEPAAIQPRPSTPPAVFTQAHDEMSEEHTTPPLNVVVHPPPSPPQPAAVALTPEPAPAPVLASEPVSASISASAFAPLSPPREDLAPKYNEALAEIERLKALLATAPSAPLPELRRRTRALSDDGTVIPGADTATLSGEEFQQEGVPLQVVVIIALGVFITTYLFF